MNKKQLIEEVETEAKKYFVDASGCHDWTHVERVRALAKRIGRAESADMFVVEVAALLHDVSRGEEMRKGGMFCHAEHGAEEAKQIIVRLAANRSSSIVSRIASERIGSAGRISRRVSRRRYCSTRTSWTRSGL